MSNLNENSQSELIYIPKISIVMPTYNRAKELPRSIRSVLSQTYTDFELIIVDDASSDNSEEIVKGFNDNRILYVKLKENVGGAEARNVGIRLAKADIIAFQDSDDEWTCFKLESSLFELENDSNTGAVFSSYIQLWSHGCRLMPVGKHIFNEKKVYTSLLWQNYVDTPTLVVRKKHLHEVGGFTPTMPRYQDWDLALKLAKVTNLKYLKEPNLISYVTEGSITSNKKAHLTALELIHKSNIEAISINKELEAAWLHRIGDARLGLGVKGGRKLLLDAYKCQPMNMKYLVKFIFSLVGGSNTYMYLTSKFRNS